MWTVAGGILLAVALLVIIASPITWLAVIPFAVLFIVFAELDTRRSKKLLRKLRS